MLLVFLASIASLATTWASIGLSIALRIRHRRGQAQGFIQAGIASPRGSTLGLDVIIRGHRMAKWTLVALFLSCISLSARAEESLYGQRYIACMDGAGGVTAQVLDCIVEEHSRQDARLDEAYRDLAGHLTGDRKEALLAAQGLWVRYRDANCKVYAYPDGGTPAAIHEASCGLEMTARRAKELEDLFSG